MNFDLSWFTTIPGLFITAGVILLIIALIILIITGKKSQKEKKAKEAKQEENSTPMMTSPTNTNQDVAMQQPMTNTVAQPMPATNMNTISQTESPSAIPMPNGNITNFGGVTAQPIVQEPMMQQPMPEQSFQQPVMPEQMMQQPMPEQSFQQPVMPEQMMQQPMPEQSFQQPVIPEQMMQQPMPEQSFQQPVMPEQMMQQPIPNPVQPASQTFEPQPVAPQPFVSAPNEVQQAIPEQVVSQPMPEQSYIANPDTNQIPEVTPQTPTFQDNNVQNNVIPETQQPINDFNQNVQSNLQPEPVIYGGANPNVTDLNLNSEPHQIYGGADPMANTQTIPTIPVATNPEPVVPSEPVIQSVASINPQPVQAAPVTAVPQVNPINQQQ